METLIIKLKSGVVESLNVRRMLGDPPDGVGTVYVLLDVDGKQSPASCHVTEGRSVEIGFFDCIEVVNGKAFAFRFYERKRLDEIGDVI